MEYSWYLVCFIEILASIALFKHKGYSYFLSLNRRMEAYLFCMDSLAESATANRAECTLWAGGIKGRKKREWWREEGAGGFCENSMSSLMLCLSLAGHRFILEGKWNNKGEGREEILMQCFVIIPLHFGMVQENSSDKALYKPPKIISYLSCLIVLCSWRAH